MIGGKSRQESVNDMIEALRANFNDQVEMYERKITNLTKVN
jgi:hypothetical protein